MAISRIVDHALARPIIEFEVDTPIEINDDEVSSSITQTWTDQAIKCYMTSADCANCVIPKGNYSFTCQMNKVVPVLLKTLGPPDPRRMNKLKPYLYQ